jgi:hypothetical protein
MTQNKQCGMPGESSVKSNRNLRVSYATNDEEATHRTLAFVLHPDHGHPWSNPTVRITDNTGCASNSVPAIMFVAGEGTYPSGIG